MAFEEKGEPKRNRTETLLPTAQVIMVLNVHRNHKAYQGRGDGGGGGGGGGMEVGEEEDYIPIATLSPPE